MAVFELVDALLAAFNGLELCKNRFAKRLASDAALPLVLPLYAGQNPRAYAIEAMTHYWHEDTADREIATSPVKVVPGIVCCSSETLAAAEDFNAAKTQFKAAVMAIRQIPKPTGKSAPNEGDSEAGGNAAYLHRLIDQVLGKDGIRTEELKEAFRLAKLSRLNLLRCYAHNRILMQGLVSFSWTWATAHSSIEQVEYHEALAMAAALAAGDSDERGKVNMAIALRELSNERPDRILAHKKELAITLRANIVWREGGDVKRKPVSISGICLCPGQKLPRYVWRDKPSDTPEAAKLRKIQRVQRCDVEIEDTPCVDLLNLYRYKVPRYEKSTKHKPG